MTKSTELRPTEIGSLTSERLNRFKEEYRPKLEAVIEEHLRGDFSNWTEEHTTRSGDAKTVNATEISPVTKSCAWRIFAAHELADEHLGFVNRDRNMEALRELQDGLRASLQALGKLDFPTRLTLSMASSERYRASCETPPKPFVPPVFNLSLIEQALHAGIEQARELLEDEEQQQIRAKRPAAAVAKICREVYEARTGKPAPHTVRDQPQKKGPDPKPAAFQRFCQAVFDVLGISERPASALRLLSSFSN